MWLFGSCLMGQKFLPTIRCHAASLIQLVEGLSSKARFVPLWQDTFKRLLKGAKIYFRLSSCAQSNIIAVGMCGRGYFFLDRWEAEIKGIECPGSDIMPHTYHSDLLLWSDPLSTVPSFSIMPPHSDSTKALTHCHSELSILSHLWKFLHRHLHIT